MPNDSISIHFIKTNLKGYLVVSHLTSSIQIDIAGIKQAFCDEKSETNCPWPIWPTHEI
jgi:hypothetical protein